MSEVSDLLQQKAGLSPEKAQEVEQVVTEHLRSRVPAQFQGILDSVLGTAGSAGDQVASTDSGGLGSLLSAGESLFGVNKG